MKRFMLVSLMSCMLVGQTSCWDWSEFGRGLSNAVLKSSLATVCAVPFGFLIKQRPGGLTIAGAAGAGLVSFLGLAQVAWKSFELAYNETLPTTASIAEPAVRRRLPTLTHEQESYLVGSVAGNVSIFGAVALFMSKL